MTRQLQHLITIVGESVAECYCLQYCVGMSEAEQQRIAAIIYDYCTMAMYALIESQQFAAMCIPDVSRN